ncbi:MAG TPA: apolipoprotein N-acyltransferase [Rhizomicrobium sp.]
MATIVLCPASEAGLWRRTAAAGAFVRRLSPWRGRGLAFGCGLCSALAFAPFGIFPCLLLAFAVVVLLIDATQMQKRPVMNAALVGWFFGFGQFLGGLYWVGYAFTVDPSQHAWQIPFVEMLLPGGLALFPAAACALAACRWREGAARIFVFAASYGACEWLRGHMLTGFPWNLSAYAWGAALPVLQSAAVIGAYGLSLLTILFGASLAELLGDARRRWLPAFMTGLFVLLWAGGALRLSTVSSPNVPGVELRLVQPNVRQQDKYLTEYRARNWQELVALTTAPARIAPTDIVWPEAAPPFLLTRVPEALDEIAALTARQRVLITGAVRVLAAPDGGFRYFNSVYIFGHGGKLLDVYDKFHLVPFGEYLPLAGLLTTLGISKLVDSPGGFTPGDGPHTYTVPNAPPVGPLICYEILFPGEVVATTRPGWLVNVTDDSWFGPSTGPYQHLLTARVRAIEEGLPVARAANTGISAVIDPFGRVVSSLGLGRAGVVDSPLPRALQMTAYARFGDLGFALIVAFCVLLAFRRRSQSREQTDLPCNLTYAFFWGRKFV